MRFSRQTLVREDCFCAVFICRERKPARAGGKLILRPFFLVPAGLKALLIAFQDVGDVKGGKKKDARMLRLKSFSFDVIVPYKSPWLTGCVL